jgi:DNA-binding NarL/FixJ family response regulator
MRLLARGKSNKEVAYELSIGVRTVETHHANLLRKLQIASAGEIARIAIRDGII